MLYAILADMCEGGPVTLAYVEGGIELVRKAVHYFEAHPERYSWEGDIRYERISSVIHTEEQLNEYGWKIYEVVTNADCSVQSHRIYHDYSFRRTGRVECDSFVRYDGTGYGTSRNGFIDAWWAVRGMWEAQKRYPNCIYENNQCVEPPTFEDERMPK